MNDYADKTWLRPHRQPFIPRAIIFLYRLAILAAILFSLAWILSLNDAQASPALAKSCKRGAWVALLADDYRAATLADCSAAYPSMPRAAYVVSRQNGTGLAWHHRFCGWN